MTILKSKESVFTSNLSETERQLGIDIKLDKNNDLQLNNRGDLDLSIGSNNAGQALFLKLNIRPGGLVYHPAIGVDIPIGEKTRNAFEVRNQIIRSLKQDPRFENPQVRVTVRGNTIIIDLKVTLVRTNQEVPLNFVVVR